MKFAKASAPIGVALCFLLAGGDAAFAQWPGQEKEPAQSGAGAWPGAGKDWTGDSEGGAAAGRARADNLLCAFDYRRAIGDIAAFGAGPGGKPICPGTGINFGSYFSGDRLKALEALIDQAAIRKDRIVAVEKRGFRNAAALLCEARDGEIKRLVIWDPAFLEKLERQAGTPWASVAILAHEIAHHLNLDTGQRPGAIPPHERRQQELHADYYAGAKLRALGASRQQAVAVFHHMGAGGTTHPPSGQRVAAAGRGWDGSSAAGTRNDKPAPGYSPPRRPGDRTRQPSPGTRIPYGTRRPQPMIATVCMTNRGFCGANPMFGRVPVGAACACYTPYGIFPGIGR